MNDAARKDLDRIDESLSSITETAKSLAVDAGADSSGDLGSRADVLHKALQSVRSDVQELRESLG